MTMERDMKQQTSRPGRSRAASSVDDAILSVIGDRLKASLKSMVHQPVPETMAVLLARLEQWELRETGEYRP